MELQLEEKRFLLTLVEDDIRYQHSQVIKSTDETRKEWAKNRLDKLFKIEEKLSKDYSEGLRSLF